MFKELFRRLKISIHNTYIKWCHPIQDDIWLSRRWNKNKTDYEDMSG